MSIELDRPARGVAAFVLSLSTLFALEKNGALAADQTKEQRRARQKFELQALYRQFIQDASKSTPSATPAMKN